MPGETFGFDLVSLNLQRGREHAIPSYNRYTRKSKNYISWIILKLPSRLILHEIFQQFLTSLEDQYFHQLILTFKEIKYNLIF
jgi:hypothetical protein